jgi:hypothetical protein
VDGMHTYDGVLLVALKGLFCNIAITTLVPCSLRHEASHLGFSGPEPFCRPGMLPPSATRTPRVGFWRGAQAVSCQPVTAEAGFARNMMLS